MSVKKEKIYIIKAHTINDADRIIVFLTEKGKKKSGVAKNALRLKSRFAGKVEPYSFCEIEYYEKNNDSNNLCSINSVNLINNSFKSVGGNMGKFTALSLINEILDNFVYGAEGNSKLYRLVDHCLSYLVSKNKNIHLPLTYFILWILKLSGSLPDFKSCAVCGEHLSKHDYGYFNNKEFFCKNHCESGIKITGESFHILEKMENSALKDVESLQFDSKILFLHIYKVLTIYSEKEFKSYNLLKTFI